ncbi:MAG: lysine exporter LysO family protein [Eubacteriales bacterium]|nr:lysine exporter LysO family protein [Eubacteriales bacterium]
MIKYMLLCVGVGFAAGRLDYFQGLAAVSTGTILVCLCLMTFIASIDMGKKDFLKDLKNAGWKIIVYSFATIIGTLIMVWIVSPMLPLSSKDVLVAASGMGWYSLATGLVFDYSPSLSVVTFVYCLLREMTAMFLMPLLWKRFQAPELVSIAGSAAMNPSIAAATITGDQRLVFYGMVSGSIVSVFVPVLVPFMIAL